MKTKINGTVRNYFLAALLAVIGLVMLIWPAFCIKIVVVLAGLATIINGIYNLINFYNFCDDKIYKKSLLIRCISSIIIGTIAVLFPIVLMKSFTAIWTVITYVLAIFFILYAGVSIFSVSMMQNVDKDLKKRITQESMIYLLIAIILFVIPIGSVIATIIRIAGIAAIVFGLLLIIRELVYSKKMNSVKNN